MALSEQEWMIRLKARIKDKGGVGEELADQAARAMPFEDMSDGWEDDPEGAADMEVLYWRDEDVVA